MIAAIDLFAGGGGASTGIEQAIGRPVSLAINHDPHAIQTHADNHPRTVHRCEAIQTVDPRRALDDLGGGALDLLWASPSCTHFSRARGAVPVSRQLRGLGWQIPRWAAATRPRLILAENVPEWTTWGPVRRGRPVARRSGDYFRALVQHLRGLGYLVDTRTLIAADYGAPTTRKRLYLIARRDAAPVWPEPTHGPGRAHPHRTAAGCIDWSDLGTSIFERKRPLAAATCRRIAAGLVRYVIEAKRPFLVTCNHGKPGFRGQSVDEPMRTVTASRDAHGLVTAFIAKHYGGVVGHGIERPLGTVTAVDHHSLVTGCMVRFNHGDKQWNALDEPLGTVMAQGQHHALVAAFLTTYYSGGGTAASPTDPLPTVVAKARHGLVTVDIDGTTYAITDIRLRMLRPRELANAMGFPSDYILRGTQAQQIARIGNAVCPPVAAALVRANQP